MNISVEYVNDLTFCKSFFVLSSKKRPISLICFNKSYNAQIIVKISVMFYGFN